MQRQVALWTRHWEAVRAEPNQDMDRVVDWLARNLPAEEDDSRIVHGDYRLGTVLIHPHEPRIVAVLDWELSTIGHPLADLGYACITYHLAAGSTGRSGLLGEDFSGTGIPDQQTFVANYARSVGCEPPDGLKPFVVFSMFRLAAITAGVWRRGLDGNAADASATESEYRDRYREVAGAAWSVAQSELT